MLIGFCTTHTVLLKMQIGVTLSVLLQHFVSERKYDEELGRSARFSCDTEQLKTQIQLCGESKCWWFLTPKFSEHIVHIPVQKMLAEIVARVPPMRVQHPAIGGLSGCSRHAAYAQVNCTVWSTLDSLYVWLHSPSASVQWPLCQRFLGITQNSWSFPSQQNFQVEIKVSAGEHSNSMIYE